MISQCDAIIQALKAGRVITPMDALRDYGCMRLAGRIADIKKAGFDIRDDFVEHNGKRFKKYWLNTARPMKDMFLSEEGMRQHEYAKGK